MVQFSRQYFESFLKAQGYDFSTVSKKSHDVSIIHDPSVKLENVYKMTDKFSTWNPVKKQALAIHKKSGAERIIV